VVRVARYVVEKSFDQLSIVPEIDQSWNVFQRLCKLTLVNEQVVVRVCLVEPIDKHLDENLPFVDPDGSLLVEVGDFEYLAYFPAIHPAVGESPDEVLFIDLPILVRVR